MTPPSGPEEAPPAPLSLGEIFRRFRRNIAIVVGSRLIFGLVNLATNVLIVRAFGVAELGIAVLLQGYVRLFAGIVKLESWQAILRFGAVAQEEAEKSGDLSTLRRLYGFTFLLDVVSITLAMIGAMVMVPYAAEILGWPPDVADFAPLFVLSMLFITHGTANGILRLYDRVDALAWQFASNATLRFLGVGLAVLLEGGVYHIVLAWFAASVISGIWPLVVAFCEMRARGSLPLWRWGWSDISPTFPGIWRFLWFTNLKGQFSLVLNHGTTLFIGAQLGSAAAGTYEVARRFSNALSRPTRMLGPLIFPDIAKLAAQQDWIVIRKLLLKQIRVTALILLGISAILFPILPWLIDLLFGGELSDATLLFYVLVGGVFISVLGFALEPIMLSANKPGTVLVMSLIAILIYVVISVVFYTSLGVIAFALGLLGYYISYHALFMTVGMRLLAKRRRRSYL